MQKNTPKYKQVLNLVVLFVEITEARARARVFVLFFSNENKISAQMKQTAERGMVLVTTLL